MSDPDTFYVTTPIYYPNGEPHLGSVYTTVLADVLARYHRLSGVATYFLTGTDEHGTKMAKAAEAQNSAPQALADRYANIFADTWRELEITNDDFLRTTEPRHKYAVQRIVQGMLDSGDIYLGSYKGWYDEGQEQFVTETEARAAEFKSTISGKPLSRYEEPSYFFRLSKYAPRVLAHIEANASFIIPESRRNEVISKLRAGVEDLSISRATLKWGIPMPNDPAHVVYVWIDALTNYITALGYASDDDYKFRRFWPAKVHLIGKDILWFHAVYWPAMLMSLGLELPQTIAAHGWWVRGGMKAGKSTGGITTLAEIRAARQRYSLDALRYYMLRAAAFGSDLEWSDSELGKSFNELANVVGNCLNRTIKMIARYRNGILPPAWGAGGAGGGEAIDNNLMAQTQNLAAGLKAAYGRLAFQDAALLPIELARAANGYIDATAPFSLAKDPAKVQRLDRVLNLSAQTIKTALAALLPILPEKASAGLSQLGISIQNQRLSDLFAQELPTGQQLGEGVPLFPKLTAGGQAPPTAPGVQ